MYLPMRFTYYTNQFRVFVNQIRILADQIQVLVSLIRVFTNNHNLLLANQVCVLTFRFVHFPVRLAY